MTVAGVVTDATTGQPVGGVTVRAVGASTQTDATATTDGNGFYSMAGIGSGPVNFTFSAPNYNTRQAPINVPPQDTRHDVQVAPFFRRTGTGDTVFDMPTYVSRVRITGTFTGFSSNWIVRIGGRLIVNELLGTGWNMTRHEGTYLTSGGVVEIVSSSGVQWEFQQIQ